MSIEAMKLALDALSNTDTHPISSAEQYFKETQAIEALGDAIEDAEEERRVNIKKLIEILNDPEFYCPNNFDTPERANALLAALCQQAADALQQLMEQSA
jgi:hypothetical protein